MPRLTPRFMTTLPRCLARTRTPACWLTCPHSFRWHDALLLRAGLRPKSATPAPRLSWKHMARAIERTYDCRHIEQYKVRNCYPSLAASVGMLLDRAPLAGDCTLAIDHTGVGRPVFDMFVNDLRHPVGITITGGELASGARPAIPRREDSAGRHLCFLQSGLRIGAKLSHAGTLQKELRDFRAKDQQDRHRNLRHPWKAHTMISSWRSPLHSLWVSTPFRHGLPVGT